MGYCQNLSVRQSASFAPPFMTLEIEAKKAIVAYKAKLSGKRIKVKSERMVLIKIHKHDLRRNMQTGEYAIYYSVQVFQLYVDYTPILYHVLYIERTSRLNHHLLSPCLCLFSSPFRLPPCFFFSASCFFFFLYFLSPLKILRLS